MAAPNIVGVATITGKTAVANAIGNSTAVEILANGSSSDDVYKVNAILVSNVYGADTTVTVDFRRGGVDYSIVTTIDVPNKSTLDVLNKPIYLEEGDSLRILAGHAAALDAVCSYEVITD
tara:strand:- start:922 stop:1281 length:360 start_codon:yes stop_codon:yes gene_type:complete